MSLLDTIILGIVQGLTEFIPVSSSGHLIVFREILGMDIAGALAVDAVLQLASGFAILAYFSKEFSTIRNDTKLLKALAIGTLPAVVLGLLLEDVMSTAFRSVHLVSLTLILGAILMWFAELYSREDQSIDSRRGFGVGLFQSLALVPGVSRSGATISGGLLLGLKRETAIRFSFLLALPIILGSGMKKLIGLYQSGLLSSIGPSLLVGSVFSFIFSLLAITFLIRYLKDHKLTPFIWYRIILALIIFVFI